MKKYPFMVHYYETGEEYIAEGGTAMMVWSRMQFDDVSQPEWKAILKALPLI
jgi:hypothetical protein